MASMAALLLIAIFWLTKDSGLDEVLNRSQFVRT